MKTLHYKLFFSYTALILPLLLVFLFVFYQVFGDSLRMNARNELQADCDNIATLLDTQIGQIDQLSKAIVSSKTLKSQLTGDLFSNTSESYRNRFAFQDTLFDLVKLSFGQMRFLIRDMNGHSITVDTTSRFEVFPREVLTNDVRFLRILEAYGKKVLFPPQIMLDSTEDTLFYSLGRSFSTGNRQKHTAVLELQIPYEYLDAKITSAVHNPRNLKQIYVYAQDGTLMYPNPDLSLTTSIDRIPDNPTLLLTSKKSPLTEWNVYVLADESRLFSTYYIYRILLISGSFLLLLFLLFLTWRIADRLTIPLKKLEQTAARLTIDNLGTIDLHDTRHTFQEVESLYSAFARMQENLSQSVKDTIAAYSMAADAKILALSAQMNPHLLHNSLATIAAFADAGDTAQAVSMCHSLSVLLRYIAAHTSPQVTLFQELEILNHYLYLIKLKYGERIQFQTNIDTELSMIQVPRLLLQPLVENCIKYGLNTDPPWFIEITGHCIAHTWQIQVTDSGNGFSPDFLETFQLKIQEFDWKKPLPELSIQGMGLLNLYMRLFLIYKDDLIFKLENKPGQGAMVLIGGPFFEKEGDQSHE